MFTVIASVVGPWVVEWLGERLIAIDHDATAHVEGNLPDVPWAKALLLAADAKPHSFGEVPEGTEFQQAVWNAMLDIPLGSTRTYQQIAEAIGKPGAVRAVGGACRKNPWPLLVPCHRVTAAKGLGGYMGQLHHPVKEKLLAIEASRAK